MSHLVKMEGKAFQKATTAYTKAEREQDDSKGLKGAKCDPVAGNRVGETGEPDHTKFLSHGSEVAFIPRAERSHCKVLN